MQQASLAFFQNFYTNVSLYVVAEVEEKAPQMPVSPLAATSTDANLPAEVAVPAVPVATTPIFAPQPAPPAVARPAASVVPPAVAPVAPSKLPSLAALNLPPRTGGGCG